MESPAKTQFVDLFERGGGWVASGDSDQWTATFEALERLASQLAAQWSPYDTDVNLEAKQRRTQRLKKDAWTFMFQADQWGRVSSELFVSEADIIREAITA